MAIRLPEGICKIACFWVLFSLSAAALSGAPIFPASQGYVTDNAQILDAAARSALERRLSDYERQTGIEIAVVIVQSLEGQSLETYANQLFRAWGIGKEKEDNGILLLIAVQDRQMRIEVGYGLESRVTDGAAGEIIRTILAPSFRNNQFADGIEAAVQRLMSLASGTAPPTVSSPGGGGLDGFSHFLSREVLHWHPDLKYFWAMCAFAAPAPFAGILAFGLLLVLGVQWTLALLGAVMVFFLRLIVDRRIRRVMSSDYGGGMGGGFGGNSGGFGGFGGGLSGGGGASGGW